MSGFERRTITLVAAAIVAAWGPTVYGEQPSGRVSLARGESLPHALAKLHRISGRVVVSELPTVVRTMPSDLGALDERELIANITSRYQLFCVRRGDALAFQLRYMDPFEDPNLDIEELGEVVSDIHRLAVQACPYPADLRIVTDKIQFVKSLSPDQLRWMTNGSLRVSALDGRQRDLWSKINICHGYADMALQYARAERAFQNWGQTSLRISASDGSEPRFVFVSPGLPGERHELLTGLGTDPGRSLPVASGPQHKSADPTTEAGVQINDPAGPYRNELRAKVALPPGTQSLAEVIERVCVASGCRVDYPSYAGARRIMTDGEGGTAAQWLAAIEGLYGWRLQPVSGKHLKLGRGRIAAVRNASELHQRVRTAIPPALYQLWAGEAARSWAPREARQLSMLARVNAFHTHSTGDSVRTSDLDGTTQRLVAQLVLQRLLRGVTLRYTQSVEAPGWLSQTGSGVFSLSGQPGPGRHPLLRFRVYHGDGGFDGWGWYVGTSSLEKP